MAKKETKVTTNSMVDEQPAPAATAPKKTSKPKAKSEPKSKTTEVGLSFSEKESQYLDRMLNILESMDSVLRKMDTRLDEMNQMLIKHEELLKSIPEDVANLIEYSDYDDDDYDESELEEDEMDDDEFYDMLTSGYEHYKPMLDHLKPIQAPPPAPIHSSNAPLFYNCKIKHVHVNPDAGDVTVKHQIDVMDDDDDECCEDCCSDGCCCDKTDDVVRRSRNTLTFLTNVVNKILSESFDEFDFEVITNIMNSVADRQNFDPNKTNTLAICKYLMCAMQQVNQHNDHDEGDLNFARAEMLGGLIALMICVSDQYGLSTTDVMDQIIVFAQNIRDDIRAAVEKATNEQQGAAEDPCEEEASEDEATE